MDGFCPRPPSCKQFAPWSTSGRLPRQSISPHCRELRRAYVVPISACFSGQNLRAVIATIGLQRRPRRPPPLVMMLEAPGPAAWSREGSNPRALWRRWCLTSVVLFYLLVPSPQGNPVPVPPRWALRHCGRGVVFRHVVAIVVVVVAVPSARYSSSTGEGEFNGTPPTRGGERQQVHRSLRLRH